MEEWQARDPIERLRRYLNLKGLWTEQEDQDLWDWARDQVNAAVKEAEEMGRPDPESIFDYVYAELPWNLKEQKDKLLAELARRQGEVKQHG